MNNRQRDFVSKIKHLEHQATPAPWSQYGDSIEGADKVPLANMTREHFEDRNAEFITALRNAMPRLLQLIEQQEREIVRLKGDGDRTGGGPSTSASFMQ